MQHSSPALNVYIHFDWDDREIVQLLGDRLSGDGVTVHLREEADEQDTRQLLSESHVVIFCISTRFNKAALRAKDTQIALETVLARRGGISSLLPVRLEDCNIAASLRRWQAIDLFKSNGYERLMQALILRADRVGISIPVQDGWRTPFMEQEEERSVQPPVDVLDQSARKSPWGFLFALSIVAAFSFFLFRNLISPPASETAIPVDVLAANATRSVLEREQAAAATGTAQAFDIMHPLTVTADYRTGVPLTKTAVHEISLYTPTFTPSPTITYTPRTIVGLPNEIIDANNVTMVLVPEGGFIMGDDTGQENTRPAYSIYLIAYYIDKFEVTNAVYQPCVDAGVCSPPRSSASQTQASYYGNPVYSEYPVINVDWQMARTFCEWRGARLPTEAEWEKAARGPDARLYPWGGETGCSFANYQEGATACVGDTVEATHYRNGISVYGVYNLAGNASEWVSSLYKPYPYNALDGREDLTVAGARVLRGGSWASSLDGISTFFRFNADPKISAVAGNDVGFRCAHDAVP